MPRTPVIALTLAAALCAAGPAAHAVIVQDTFDLPTPGSATTGDDAGDPLDLAFVASGGGAAIGVSDDPVLGSGNSLNLATLNGFDYAIGTFAEQLLQVGDALTLAADFRLTGEPIGSNDDGFRVGFGRANKVYGFQVGTGNTASVEFHRYGGGTPDGQSAEFAATGDAAIALNDGDAHHFSFTITRTASEVIGFDLVIDGTHTYAGSTGSSQYNFANFDTLVIGVGSIANGVRIDNVTVTPEPASLALLGLGGLLLLPARRAR